MIKNPRLHKPSSLYDLIESYCQSKDNRNVVHRLCNLARKMDVRAIIVEDITIDDEEIRPEIIALEKYFDKTIKAIAYRFTFINKFIDKLENVKELSDENFLSTFILINIETNAERDEWKSYVYKAVVVPPRLPAKKYGKLPLLNNYLHIYKTFRCQVSYSVGKFFEFSIRGNFFCQQNNITSVCAHASLCMVINNIEIGLKKLIIPEDINEILNIDHIRFKFGITRNGGLEEEEINQVLKTFKLKFYLINYKAAEKDRRTRLKINGESYDKIIYKYLEGKHPVLLVFTTKKLKISDGTTGFQSDSHVVPVFGHTLNTDAWRPQAERAYREFQESRVKSISASSWVDHFIIHDDNFGMYFCLPVDSLKKQTKFKDDPEFRAYYTIAIIPSEVATYPWEPEYASQIVIDNLLQKFPRNLDKWYKRLLEDKPWVIRTILMAKNEYKNSLNCKDFDGNKYSEQDVQEILRNLPDYFWLSEISLPDLYVANKSKLVDFFYPCDNPETPYENEVTERLIKSWIQARMPHVLIQNNNGKLSIREISVGSHCPIFRFETELESLDW